MNNCLDVVREHRVYDRHRTRRIFMVTLICLFAECAAIAPLAAKTINIEFLQGSITPKNSDKLGGLACRNYDHIVRLKIYVTWPASAKSEGSNDRRLVFWDNSAEFLFPSGSYVWLHGDYVINGYFIPRTGG